MALVNGFDPSKEYVVVKGFFEGGKNYRSGDKYAPKTKIGKSKVLFRHFIAKRIKLAEDETKKQPVEEQATTNTPDEGFVQKEVQEESEVPVEETPKPRKTRGRRKKSTEDV